MAKRVGVSEETIRGFVSGELRASLDLDLDLVLEALESAGVDFVDIGGTPSVRLRKASE